MANLLWGQVYYKEHFAGILREEPGDRTSFSYDDSYLNANHPAIAYTLLLQQNPHINHSGLHPFFDNLVAEGWLESAQTRLLGKRTSSRFELLLSFGQDCAGAVSIIDPEPSKLTLSLSDLTDPKELAIMTSRASLSGIQPKLTLVERLGKLHPAKNGETSTYIAKFPSQNHNDLVTNEYLSTLAFKALLPEDDVVDLHIGEIEGFAEPALIIKRFDRNANGERIHFEEFNQLLGYASNAKYDGSHKDIADFIRHSKGSLTAEIYRLYLRILAGLLIGNTDMHLKNFAMFHTKTGLRLTPSYDAVSAALYNYKTVALAIGGSHNLILGNLKPSHIIKLGAEFQLSNAAIQMAFEHLSKRIEAAKQAVTEAKIEAVTLKKQLIDLMEKRWNGTFALIGQKLLTKR